MPDVTVLRTERLVLTPVQPGDHALLREHWGRPQVRAFLFDGKAPTAKQVTGLIEESMRGFATDGHGLWTVRLGDGGTFVGTAGLLPLDDTGELEVLYSLEPQWRGRGLATEAARAVLDHGLGVLGRPRILAEIDEGNRASAAVAERLGMRPCRIVPGVLGPMTRYTT